jgi:hypothetical protein
VFFLLLVEREDRLPLTIVSRCQKIIFGEKYQEIGLSPQAEEFYREFEAWLGRPFSERAALEFSARLSQDKDEAEELLYGLAILTKEKLGKIKITKFLLEAAKNLKKNANVKLTLDVAFLKMGEAWSNS